MLRDLVNNIKSEYSVAPQVISGAAVNGVEIDLLGADSAAIVVAVGAIVGSAGDASVSIQETDTAGTGYTTVAAADIIGSLPTLAASSNYQFGYKGSKRYIRVIGSRGTETSVALSASVIKGHLHKAPDGVVYAS